MVENLTECVQQLLTDEQYKMQSKGVRALIELMHEIDENIAEMYVNFVTVQSVDTTDTVGITKEQLLNATDLNWTGGLERALSDGIATLLAQDIVVTKILQNVNGTTLYTTAGCDYSTATSMYSNVTVIAVPDFWTMLVYNCVKLCDPTIDVENNNTEEGNNNTGAPLSDYQEFIKSFETLEHRRVAADTLYESIKTIIETHIPNNFSSIARGVLARVEVEGKMRVCLYTAQPIATESGRIKLKLNMQLCSGADKGNFTTAEEAKYITDTEKLLRGYGLYKGYTTKESDINYDTNSLLSVYKEKVVDYLILLQTAIYKGYCYVIQDITQVNGVLRIQHDIVKLDDLQDLVDKLWGLYLAILYINRNNADIQEVIDNEEAYEQADSYACLSLVRKYLKPLIYTQVVTYADNTQVNVLAIYAAEDGSDETEGLYSYLSTKNTKTNIDNGKVFYNIDASRMLCQPDIAKRGSITASIIINAALYYSKADFGYKANHRIYEKTLVSTDKILLGRDMTGNDLYFEKLYDQSCPMLAIFAGSRSGKGVLTNNIIGSLLSAGTGVVYVDNKPEQAVALWQFESYFNQHFSSITNKQLKMLAVDWNTPGMATDYNPDKLPEITTQAMYDATIERVIAERKIEGTKEEKQELAEIIVNTEYFVNIEITAPTHGAVNPRIYNVPEFFSHPKFKQFCKDNNATELYSAKFFKGIRVLKLLHAIFCLNLIRSNADTAAQNKARTCGIKKQKRFVLIWDELQRTCSVTAGPWHRTLNNVLNAIENRKKQWDKKIPEDEQEEYTVLMEAKKYFEIIKQQYFIYNAKTGDGNVDASDKKYQNSVLTSCFGRIISDANGGGFRLVSISQQAPQVKCNKYPIEFMNLFNAGAIIMGRAGFNGVDNKYAYNQAPNYADAAKNCKLVEGELKGVLPGLKGEVAGYFTYRINKDSELQVFKSYLTLLDNDYFPVQYSAESIKDLTKVEQHSAPAGAGTCNASIGMGAVAGLVKRTAESLRESVVRMDVYKTDGTLNAEIGFIGATMWLMCNNLELTTASTNKTFKECLEQLIDDLNRPYDEILIMVNNAGGRTYNTVEDYINDMSYASLYTGDTGTGWLNAEHVLPDDEKVQCETETINMEFVEFNNCSKHTDDDNTDDDNTDDDNTDDDNTDDDNTNRDGTNEGNTNSGNTNSGNTKKDSTNSGNTNDGNTNSGNTNSGNTKKDSTNSDNKRTVVTVKKKVQKDNTDSGSTNGGSTNGGSTNGGSTNGGNTNGGSTNGGSTNGGSTNIDNTKKGNATKPCEEYTVISEADAKKLNTDYTNSNSVMALYKQKDLTKLLTNCIANYVNKEYQLITKVKIDDIGRLYINDVLIAPQVEGTNLQVAPALEQRIQDKCWGDVFMCNTLKKYHNLQILDIAQYRAVTCARELGIGNDLTQLKNPKLKRNPLPALSTLYVGGQLINTIQDDDNDETYVNNTQQTLLAERIRNNIDDGAFADTASKLWNRCSPLRICTKVFGYSVGLNIAWAAASFMGPIGLAVTGLGTLATALLEFDTLKAERQSIQSGGGRRQTQDVIDVTPTSEKKSTKK